MAYKGAPKLYSLKSKESFSTFEAWRQNTLFHLQEDPKFAPYLTPGVTWKKLTPANRHRGFADDGEEVVTAADRKSKEAKNAVVERMLNQVANFYGMGGR